MPKRPFYGVFNEREWPQVQAFADKERVNISELLRRALQVYAEQHGLVIQMDERSDYHERSRRV